MCAQPKARVAYLRVPILGQVSRALPYARATHPRHAASMTSASRAKREAGDRRSRKNTDFLICAAALRRDHAIFTTDGDFRHFARVLKLQLHESPRLRVSRG